MSVAESFWSHTKPSPTGCWEWQRAMNPDGYGNLRYQGRTRLAHRVAWQLARGPIPSGLYVCHHCDNRGCVRPTHLFIGTHTDNLQDSSQKGRMHPGSRHGMAKVTERDVEDIRFLHAVGASTRAQLAAEFGLSEGAIDHILKRRTWAHV